MEKPETKPLGKKAQRKAEQKAQGLLPRGLSISTVAADMDTYQYFSHAVKAYRFCCQKLVAAAHICDRLAAHGGVVERRDKKVYELKAEAKAKQAGRAEKAEERVKRYFSAQALEQLSKETQLVFSGKGVTDEGSRYGNLKAYWDELRGSTGYAFNASIWANTNASLASLFKAKAPITQIPRLVRILSGDFAVPKMEHIGIPLNHFCAESGRNYKDVQIRLVHEVLMFEDKEVDGLYADLTLETGVTKRLILQGVWEKTKKTRGEDGSEIVASVKLLKELDSYVISRLVRMTKGGLSYSAARLSLNKGRLSIFVSYLDKATNRAVRMPERVMVVTSKHYVAKAGKHAGTEYDIFGSVPVKAATEVWDKFRNRGIPCNHICTRLLYYKFRQQSLQREVESARNIGPAGAKHSLQAALDRVTKAKANYVKKVCRVWAALLLRFARAWGCATVQTALPRNTLLIGQHSFPYEQLDRYICEAAERDGVEYKPLDGKDELVQSLLDSIASSMEKEQAELEQTTEVTGVAASAAGGA